MECFGLRGTFPFVRFAIVLGRGPNLTSSGHRIPFCLLQWRLRPLGNMRCLKFPADSTLKGSLLARCRDRCYSPLIYTCPHLFVLRIPLTDWLTNTEGSGVSFVSGGPGMKCSSGPGVYLHIYFRMSHTSREIFAAALLGLY